MFDFTYACSGCGERFSLLQGDPRAELCPCCPLESGHELDARLKDDEDAPFGVIVAEGPPG